MLLGPSRQSFVESRAALAARSGQPGFGHVSAELLAVSALLGEESSLRGTLADAGESAERRIDLVRSLFAGRVSDLAVEVLAETVGHRWSEARDLVDAVEALGAEAAFIDAEQSGRLDGVEDELFRFGRVIEAAPELRSLLSDPAVTPEARAAVMRDLLSSRSDETTIRLVTHLVEHPRGRKVEEAIAELTELAAQRREQLLAEVRVAAPLTAEHGRRLSAALGRLYNRDVRIQVVVDPQVLGGVVVQVGDEVIDGSVIHKLEQARRQLGV